MRSGEEGMSKIRGSEIAVMACGIGIFLADIFTFFHIDSRISIFMVGGIIIWLSWKRRRD